jgi:amino acid permease
MDYKKRNTIANSDKLIINERNNISTNEYNNSLPVILNANGRIKIGDSENEIEGIDDGEPTEEQKELKETFLELEYAKKPICIRLFGPIREGSLRGSIIALASITFGGGCLAFSNAIKIMGLGLGLIMFFAIGYISFYTLSLLSLSAKKARIYDYNLLVVKYIGKKMLIFTDINNLILCFGLIIGYQKYIYQFLLDILKYYIGFSDSEYKTYELYVILFCFLFVQIPLTSMKKISILQYASIFGTFALIYSIVIICVKTPDFYKKNTENGEKIIIIEDFSWDYLVSISVFLFGFSSHNGIFQIYNELERPSTKRFSKVLHRAFYLEVFLYLLISIGGYLSFLNKTDANILLNYQEGDIYILISKFTLAICLHCSMAINYNIMRISYKSFLLKENQEEFVWYKDLFIAVITLLLANLIVINLTSATQILGIVGGVCCVVICFINPILIYVRAFKFPVLSIEYIFAMFVLITVNILGTASTVYCLYEYIKNLI